MKEYPKNNTDFGGSTMKENEKRLWFELYAENDINDIVCYKIFSELSDMLWDDLTISEKRIVSILYETFEING
jgi:hypothetical protein